VAKNKKKAAPKKTAAKKATQKPTKKAIAKKATPQVAAKKSKIKKATKAKSAKQVKVAVKSLKAAPATKANAQPKWSDILTPLDDRLIVTLAAKEKMTAGGLYIPDTVQSSEAHRQGVVVCVGRGHRNKKGQVRPLDVKTGDQVLFSDYSGDKIEFQGQTAYILRESEIVGVLG